MSSLVTLEEFAGYLRTSFDEEDAYSAQQVLDDATATIINEIGQELAQSTDTVTLDGTGTRELLLPRWPVNSVTSVTVTEDDGTIKTLTVDTDYRWSANGILERRSGCWPCRQRAVQVVYTPGYATIPATPKRICRRLAASAWHNPAGADQEETPDHKVRWNTPGGELTTAEKDQLAYYHVGRR